MILMGDRQEQVFDGKKGLPGFAFRSRCRDAGQQTLRIVSHCGLHRGCCENRKMRRGMYQKLARDAQ